MRPLVFTAKEARDVHSVLASLLMPQRVRDNPETASIVSALEKIRRYADEAFCKQPRCEREAYAKGMCEPCYRVKLRKGKRLQRPSEVA